MSVFAAFAPQISAIKPRSGRSQFRAENLGKPLRFVSRKGLGAKCRNAAIMRWRGEWMQRHPHSVTAILVALILCGAFAAPADAAEPSAETIARGKSLVEDGDCASRHNL